jgi:predicted nucleic acid-binding protein
MCFVLDVNAFHDVFDPNSAGHADFAPLRDWLYDHPRTSLVIGGNHYRKELNKLHKYLGKLVELKRARKLSEVLDEVVNTEEKRLEKAVHNKSFDDAHIVALFCVSGCLIFASHDKRADSFIKMRKLYPKGQHRPSIYHGAGHAALLRDANIVALRNTRR